MYRMNLMCRRRAKAARRAMQSIQPRPRRVLARTTPSCNASASTHRHIDPAMVAASRRFLKQLLDEPVRGLVRLYRPCNSIPKGHRWPTALTILTRSFPPAEAFVARTI